MRRHLRAITGQAIATWHRPLIIADAWTPKATRKQKDAEDDELYRTVIGVHAWHGRPILPAALMRSTRACVLVHSVLSTYPRAHSHSYTQRPQSSPHPVRSQSTLPLLTPVPLCVRAKAQAVDLVYVDALSRFPRSGVLHLFVAQYVKTFRPFARLEKSHLRAAEVTSGGVMENQVARPYCCFTTLRLTPNSKLDPVLLTAFRLTPNSKLGPVLHNSCYYRAIVCSLSSSPQ